MVMCSPPYWSLRDYTSATALIWDGSKGCGHRWKSEKRFLHRGSTKSKLACAQITEKQTQDNFCQLCNAWKGQLGLEPTFDLYIKHLCNIFDEVKRVLRADGTCFVVLGDTYGGSWSNYGAREGNQRVSKEKRYSRRGEMPNNWKPPMVDLPPKSLVQIPARFSIEMVNRGWILRNDIIWHKRNCMPSSANDRFTVDYEHLFFFSKNKKYYFEQQFENNCDTYNGKRGTTLTRSKMQSAMRDKSDKNAMLRYSTQGRNKRCVWAISTKPSKEPHFATYPPELCVTPIKAGCPVGGIVLDPFSGTATTAIVAKSLNRNYIGIELNPKDVERSILKLRNVMGVML